MSAVPRLPEQGPVARLVDLPPLERRVIVYLRLWTSGAAGQRDVWGDLAARLGPAPARAALGRFEALLVGAVRLAGRPLARHSLACACAGADECALAATVAAAASGRGAEARAKAAALAGRAGAEALARLAEAAGPALAAADAPRAGGCRPSHRGPARPQ